jgi:hypothetical protein
MEHLPRTPEESVAELLRVTLLLMKPYALRVDSRAGLLQLEDQMRITINSLESADSRKKGHSCRKLLQFRQPQRLAIK